MYLNTSHVFINNSVLSFHFIFQRFYCSTQAIKTRHSWKSVPFFVPQKKIPSADCLSPGQPLHQEGFWRLWELMCAQTQERLPSRDWCLTQQAKAWGWRNKWSLMHPETLKYLLIYMRLAFAYGGISFGGFRLWLQTQSYLALWWVSHDAHRLHLHRSEFSLRFLNWGFEFWMQYCSKRQSTEFSN